MRITNRYNSVLQIDYYYLKQILTLTVAAGCAPYSYHEVVCNLNAYPKQALLPCHS